jgi:hypothetical protein
MTCPAKSGAALYEGAVSCQRGRRARSGGAGESRGSSWAQLFIASSGEDQVVWEPLRWRISERAVYAARAAVAPAGAKGWSVVSLCQIASAKRRAMSTWATLAPRGAAEAGLAVLVALAVDGCREACVAASISAQRRYFGAGVGDVSAAVGAPGLVDAGAQPGVAAELLRGREASDVTDLRGDGVPEHPRDSWRAHQQRHIGVISAEGPQLGVDGGDLGPGHRSSPRWPAPRPPRLGKLQAREQLAALAAEAVADRAAVPERQQLRVNAVECRRFRGQLIACAVRRGGKDVRGAQDQAAVSGGLQG